MKKKPKINIAVVGNSDFTKKDKKSLVELLDTLEGKFILNRIATIKEDKAGIAARNEARRRNIKRLHVTEAKLSSDVVNRAEICAATLAWMAEYFIVFNSSNGYSKYMIQILNRMKGIRTYILVGR